MDLATEKLYLTPFPFSPLFPMLIMSLAKQRQAPVTKTRIRREYDYIIVGGGSAGSVVASRLSEIPCINVLLLEAGKPPPKVTDIPSVAGSFIQSDIDWRYKTVPQRYTGAALMNRQVILAQGKTLGGGSTINALVANRGNRRNYDEWAAMGATGWSFDEVFPYFLKSEDNRDQDVVANGFHGVGGPVTVSRQQYTPEVKGPIIEAAHSLGFQFVDVSGPTQHGFNDLQSTLRDGQRCTTSKAYLAPSENRTNLDIVTQALVTRIVIEDRRAVGVEFDFRGHKRSVRARREVILSAGAINTPKLLMLSGIGIISELERLRIPVIANLPVGLNLQDHQAAFIPYELSDSIPQVHKRLFDENNINDYIENRRGPLAMTSGIHLVAFLSNNATRAANDLPDYQLYFLELPALLAKLRVGISPHAYQEVFGPYQDKPLLVCMSSVLHPKSRGTVRLRSRNPYDDPEIDPNYFHEPQDVTDVAEGMKTCIRVLDSEPMSRVGAKLFNTSFPGCERFRENNIETWLRCNIQSAVMSVSHPVGTAKMGHPDDPSTVVDPQLRVKTIENLRVVDASVMPTIIWGNTNLPTIMIGEKASDMIKSTIQCQRRRG